VIIDFLIAFFIGRTARNTAIAAERSAWTEAQKIAYQKALAEPAQPVQRSSVDAILAMVGGAMLLAIVVWAVVGLVSFI
jgi:hypothetical protein